MIKKILFVFTVIAILALDVAALDDITTGSEPNFFSEYAILMASVGLFIFLGLFWYRSRKRAK